MRRLSLQALRASPIHVVQQTWASADTPLKADELFMTRAYKESKRKHTNSALHFILQDRRLNFLPHPCQVLTWALNAANNKDITFHHMPRLSADGVEAKFYPTQLKICRQEEKDLLRGCTGRKRVRAIPREPRSVCEYWIRNRTEHAGNTVINCSGFL